MPRVGGEFVAPFPPVVPDTTIESAVHNGIVADFVLDANAARPITAGGTGATSAAAARTNLQTEVAGVEVTNYDSHVWENGSFISGASATGGPQDGYGHVGTAIILQHPGYITLEARNAGDPAKKYVRQKTGGVWGPWIGEGAADYVNVAGDTMTGHLALPAGPAANQAVRKDYVDSISAATGAVLRIGDTMTGPLVIPTPSPTAPEAAYYAINRNYFDTYDTRITNTLNVLTARIEELERKIK